MRFFAKHARWWIDGVHATAGQGRVPTRRNTAPAVRGPCRARFTAPAVLLLFVFPAFSVLSAQVAVTPTTIEPAAWERFAVRVFGAGSAQVVAVRVDVPDAVAVLGVESSGPWSFRIDAATDTTPQQIMWEGGSLTGMTFREFAFLGRVAGDARARDLVFPVHVRLADSTELHFSGPPGSERPAPRVAIVGRTQLSVRGAVAVAGVAIAISLVALGLAFSRPKGGTSP